MHLCLVFVHQRHIKYEPNHIKSALHFWLKECFYKTDDNYNDNDNDNDSDDVHRHYDTLY